MAGQLRVQGSPKAERAALESCPGCYHASGYGSAECRVNTLPIINTLPSHGRIVSEWEATIFAAACWGLV